MAKKLKDLPIGAVVQDKRTSFLGDIIKFRIAHKAKDRVKLITDEIVAYVPYDVKEPNNPNHFRYQDYGNAVWKHSNIRQFLNKKGHNWFEKQHQYDEPPTKEFTNAPYAHLPAFLTGFSKDFLDSILPTKNQTYQEFYNEPNESSKKNIETIDKVYLPSRKEVGDSISTSSSQYVEGEVFDLFKSGNSARVAKISKSAAEEFGIEEGNQAYFLRSQDLGSNETLNSVKEVRKTGSISWKKVFLAYGIRPVLDLSLDISVSDKPNADGVYTLEFNAEPVIITSTSTNMGDKYAPFSIVYKVTDKEGDKVRVVEKLNNVTLRTIDSIALGEQQTIEITESQWRALPTNEQSTITITADDGQGVTTKTFTFVKRNDAPLVTLDTKDNEIFYEGSTLNISGTATDADVGDAVIVKYKLASSRERVITTQVSTGESFDYGEVLTFTKGRFYDGGTVVTDVLAEGNTYTLEVWAQDDKGATSPIQKRKFTVVPNRSPLLEITETPNAEGAALSTDLSIKGTINDLDGDDVRLTYKLNNGKEIPIAESGGTFEVNFKLSDLKQGRNTFLVIARDEYDAMATREVQVTTTAVKSPTEHIENKLYYTIDTKGVETDGILVWLRRPIGDDTDYKGYVSITQTGAVEDYQAMDKTASIVKGHKRDELIGSVGEKGADVRLKLEFDGDEAPIQMLQGVIK